MYLEILLMVIGFILLVKGANVLVKGATSLARRYGVSFFVIGLTIVAFGTSLPEFVVNITSALKGSTDIAVGNIIGSNMANILLVLGLTALIIPLEVNIYAKRRDIPYALFSSILLLILASDTILLTSQDNFISRLDGVLLLCVFFLFLFLILARSQDEFVEETILESYTSRYTAVLYILVGISGLYIGGDLIVDNAVSLARHFSISEILISSTIVAFGTSLPELTTSIIAAYNNNADIAIGNIVGSNIFNILWVLGCTSIVHPLLIPPTLLIDLSLVVIATMLLLGLTHLGKENILERPKGIMLLVMYGIYIAMLVARG
ncbi:MAG: calcium/sodium antiporter [Candidatus Methanofastidiosia archaeon]